MKFAPGDLVTINKLYFFDKKTRASSRGGVVYKVNVCDEYMSIAILADNTDLIDHSFRHETDPPGVLLFHSSYITKLSPLELLARVAE